MRIALVVTILLLLCGAGICAESQPPTPSTREKVKQPDAQTKKNNDPANQLNTCTEALAAINKLLNAQEQEKTANKNTGSHKEESTSEWWKIPDIWVAVFTGILAAITGALAYFTLMLWRATKTMVDEASLTSKRQAAETQDALNVSRQAAEAAKKSAEAAELTAQAALGVELPRFVVTSMKLIWNGTEPHISITLTNHGRTEAVVTGECLIYRKEPALAPHPRYPISSQKRIDFGKTIKTGESHIIRESIPSGDICANSDSPIIWGYGYIKYRDFLGKIHTSGFVGGASMQSCGRDVNVGRVGVDFEQQGPAAYTYEKYEENEP